MQIIPLFLKEFEMETATTRQMLELVPDDQFSYKPHEKKYDHETTNYAYCRVARLG